MMHISRLALTLMSNPSRGKILKAKIRAFLLQLLRAGIADRFISQLPAPLHTTSLIMATRLQHRNTHIILRRHLPHPPSIGEVEVRMVALRDIPATPIPTQDIARICHNTLHILRGHTLSGCLTTDMDMHLLWIKTGIIHIPSKVSLIIKLLVQCFASFIEG